MKILVLSDTHHSLHNARAVLKKLMGRINQVAHLGDHDEDAEQLSREFPDLPFSYVAGNCDFGSDTSLEQIIAVNNKKILLVHGHRHHVKWGVENLGYLGEEKQVDAVLFGHTHVPLITYSEGILIMNPGSISQPRTEKGATYGILDIDEKGIIRPSIVPLKNNHHISTFYY